MIGRRRIRIIAEQILRDCGQTQPPVSVEEVARQLSLNIRQAGTEEDIAGFLHRGSGGSPTIIGVNSNHPPTRQRFTIAHEIGHHVLHASAAFHVDDRMVPMRRDRKSEEGTDRNEIEANIFAAELIMPARFLIADLDKFGPIDFEDTEAVSKLAKRYNVSAQAMTIRLANLGNMEL